MKMKKIQTIALLALMAGLFTACYDDEGNYDYKDLGQFEFAEYSEFLRYDEDEGEFVETSYLVVRVGETFTLKPNYIVTKEDPALDFAYTWTLDGEVIGTELELTYTPNETGESSIVLNVEEKTYGTRAVADMMIQVLSPYEGCGYLVLSEQNGKRNLSFLAGSYQLVTNPDEVEPYTLYSNLYETANGTPMPDNVFKLYEHYCREGNGSSEPAQTMLVCDDQLIDIDQFEFTEVVRSDAFFLAPIAPIKDVQFMQWLDLVQDGQGRLFRRYKTTDELFHSQKFLAEPMTYQDEAHKGEVMEQIRLLPGNTSYGRGFTLVYDGKYHRFLAISDYAATNWSAGYPYPVVKVVGMISTLEAYVEEEWPKDVTIIPSDLTGYDLVYAGSRDLSNIDNTWTQVNVLREQATGQYYWQRFTVERPYTGGAEFKVQVGEIEQHELPATLAAKMADPNTIVTLLGNTGGWDGAHHPYMFFANGRDLYLYDLEDPKLGVSQPLTFESPIVAVNGDCNTGNYIGVALEDGSFYVIATNGAKNYWSWDNEAKLVRHHLPAGQLGKIKYVMYKTDGENIYYTAP